MLDRRIARGHPAGWPGTAGAVEPRHPDARRLDRTVAYDARTGTEWGGHGPARAEEEQLGAWGAGPFANDDASDWAYQLEEAADLLPARQALSATLDTDGWLEVPEAACALAAAAVIAATFDDDVEDLTGEVVDWIADHPDAATREDARLAADALERVTSEDSELRELWAGTPQALEWGTGVERLRARLVRAIGD